MTVYIQSAIVERLHVGGNYTLEADWDAIIVLFQ